MTMKTQAEASQFTGVAIHEWIDTSADIPRVRTGAAQGDVLVLRVTTRPATTPMPARVVAVSSEVTANTHTLHPSGECYWDPHTPVGPSDVLLGVLTVPEGSTAILIHQEHGALEVMPGTYQVCRQREFAGEWGYVHD